MSEQTYYDMTDPCTVCGAKSGERCIHVDNGTDREQPHMGGGRDWSVDWSAGYAAAVAKFSRRVDHSSRLCQMLHPGKKCNQEGAAATYSAMEALRRLADPTEMGGMGDADTEHNSTPEMRARLRFAKACYDELCRSADRPASPSL